MINSNKEISTPLAITIIIVLVVIFGGGILVYQYWWLPKEEAKSSEQNTQNEITSWKTYENEDWKFEIKYPEGWRMESYFLGRSSEDYEPRAGIDSQGFNFFDSNQEITISIFVGGGYSNLESAKEDSHRCIDGEDNKVFVDGVEGLVREGKLKEGCSIMWKDLKEVIVFSPTGTYFNFLTGKKNEVIFDKMLSTFRFID